MSHIFRFWSTGPLLRGVPGTSPWWVLSLPLLGGGRGSLDHSSSLAHSLFWAVFSSLTDTVHLLCLPFPPSQRGEFRGLKELLVAHQEAGCQVLRCLKVGKPTAGLAHRPESPPQHLYNCSPSADQERLLKYIFERGVGWGRKPQKSE